MSSKVIRGYVDLLIAHDKCQEADREIIFFGICTGMQYASSLLTVIVMGSTFGLLAESCAFLISFSLIRVYAGGYHCDKSINCYLLSSIVMGGILTIIKITPPNYMLPVSFIMMFLSIPNLLRFAPIETRNKPLDNDEKSYYREKLKRYLVLEVVIGVALLIGGVPQITYTISIGMVVASLAVLVQRKLIK